MQRKLIIIAIALVILGIGLGIYFYFKTAPASITASTLPGEVGLLPTANRAGGTPGIINENNSQSPSGTPLGAINSPTTVSARLVKISSGLVVPGEAVVNIKPTNASSSPEVAVSYIERQSGNVFSYLVHANKLARTSNKTVLGIQTASWLPDASFAFVRYLSGTNFTTIDTYALSATSSNGFFLSQNIADISVSSTSILTLASGVNGSVASLMRTDGTKSSTIFTTPLSALRISFAGKNQYLAFTKPSAKVLGSAFLIDSGGHFSRIAGPQNGLTALASPGGKWVLVSYMQDTAMRMMLIDTVSNSTLPVPVATIADKCIWATDDSAIYCGIPVNPPMGVNYPDDWYQGAVQFSDRIWKIQVSGRYAQLVLDFSKETKGSLDAEALAIDPANTTLVFINKNDGSLWSYQL